MSCKAIQHKLSAYLDGELPGFEMLDVRSHIHRCRSCEEEYEELRRLKWLISAVPDCEPSEEFAGRLKTHIFDPKAASRQSRVSVAMISGVAFAAALLISLAAFRAHPAQAQAVPANQAKANAANFDLVRDQAYQTGGDFFSDGSMVIPSYSSYHGNR